MNTDTHFDSPSTTNFEHKFAQREQISNAFILYSLLRNSLKEYLHESLRDLSLSKNEFHFYGMI